MTPEEERELAEDAARARRPARAALGRLRLATLAAVAPTTLVAAMVAITVVGVDLSLNDALMAPLGLFSCVAGAAVAVARAGRPVSATIEATGLLGGGVAVFAGELAGVALIYFGLMAASRGAVVAAELRARAAATMARRAFWWNAGATVAAILITPRATAGLALLVRAVSITGLLAVGVTLVIAWRTLGAVSRRQAADDMALNELG
ncbi:MAG: hypothetical protein H6745_32490 [Deltaproteobacteria bacterium]|nr:hypothetical protein [Deltaproteobacteria bacterium]